MRVQATVQEVTSKIITTKFGEKPIFNINTVDGKRLGAGFKQPACQAGHIIEYDLVMRGSYENAENITVIGEGVAAPAQQVVTHTAAPVQAVVQPAVAPAPAPVGNDRQASIVHQSSRKDAIQFVGILLAHDCLVLGSTKGKRADIVEAYVDDFTRRFFNATQTVGQTGVVPEGDEDFVAPEEEAA